MNVFIVAIPLLAAIVLAPAPVAAQDPAPVGATRKAVSRPPDSPSPGRAARPAAAPRPESTATATPPATRVAAEADDQRGRGGNRGRDNGGGNRGNAGGDRDRGRDNGGDRDRDNNRGGGPRIAVPRPPNVSVWNSSSRNRNYYPPVYYDRWARQTYRWSPLSYVPWGLVYGSVGYSNYGYYSYGSYGPSYGYGYGYGQGPWSPWGRSSSYDTGGIRLRIRPRDAQVFVNGYYAGLVDDFDGNFQQLRLEQGGHKLEIRMPGFENLQLDVHVQPNRTITIREDLKPRP
jgi:hypothetical protein